MIYPKKKLIEHITVYTLNFDKYTLNFYELIKLDKGNFIIL